MACYNVSLKGVEPKKHQLKVANYINKETKIFGPEPAKALIVAHGVGTGKTITSILSAVCFLKNNPGKKVIILAPASILEQFSNEVKKLVNEEFIKDVYCYSHTWWLNHFKRTIIDLNEIKNKKNIDKYIENEIEELEEDIQANPDIVEKEFILPDDNMLIVDEAHKFRTETAKNAGYTYARLLNEAALRSKKVLLLTATPVVNSEKDLRNYLAIVNEQTIEKEYKEASVNNLKKDKFLKNYVKCAFSYFKSDDTENYPVVNEHIIKIPMTEDYEKMYDKVQDNRIKEEPSLVENFNKDPIPFLNGLRKAVNFTNMESPKIKWILDKVLDEVSHNRRVVIYSALKDFGVNIIRDGLKHLEIECGIITGNVNKNKRFEIMSDYNSGKVPVLLISAAGAEGLDLKETRSLIILEPYWNDARLDQVKGRAVRYRSHANLPKKDRTVDIYTLVLTKRTPATWGFKGISARLGNLLDGITDMSSPQTKIRNRLTLATADEILLKLSEMKTEKILNITQKIINGSIEKNSC